jgi:hypothetical protein
MYLDTGVFEQLNRVAVALSQSSLVPAHLQGKPADCLLLTAQAMRWNIDPLVCAQHSFVHKGKVGYEGKLVAAIINSALKSRGEGTLDFAYSTVGGDRKIEVSAKVDGRDKKIEGFVSRWKTDNGAWAKDPDQMLAYRGARQWARLWMPEILLGVSGGADEVEEREVVDVTDKARVVTVIDALAQPNKIMPGNGATFEPQPAPDEPKTRKRRTRAEIEADEAREAADEKRALEVAGQATLDIESPVEKKPAAKPEIEDAVVTTIPDDDEPATTEATADELLAKAVAEGKVSDAQKKWMEARFIGIAELTSVKAIELMNEKMSQQLKPHPVLATVWEAARKSASAKFK